MSKDIVDLIKAQGNQACVMIPDIMDIPAIDLGDLVTNPGIINLSTDKEEQLIAFIDKHKNSCKFWLEFAERGFHQKILMTRPQYLVGPAEVYLYVSFPINYNFNNDTVTTSICVISLVKAEDGEDLLYFRVKEL